MLVPHYWSPNVVTNESVSFNVFKEDDWFKAIPLMSKEEGITTSLPEEVLFVYVNHCVVAANDMEEETLVVIKKLSWSYKCCNWYNCQPFSKGGIGFFHRPLT